MIGTGTVVAYHAAFLIFYGYKIIISSFDGIYTVLFLLNAPGALNFVKGGRLLGIDIWHIV